MAENQLTWNIVQKTIYEAMTAPGEGKDICALLRARALLKKDVTRGQVEDAAAEAYEQIAGKQQLAPRLYRSSTTN